MKKVILSALLALGIFTVSHAQYVKVVVFNNTTSTNWIFKTADSSSPPIVMHNGYVPLGSPAINVAYPSTYNFPINWKVVDPNGTDTGNQMFSGAVGSTTISLSAPYSVTYEVQDLGGGQYNFLVFLN
ncbi:MAG: hypothetical protein R2825_05260 [Saprospiraceae bacterium]